MIKIKIVFVQKDTEKTVFYATNKIHVWPIKEAVIKSVHSIQQKILSNAPVMKAII